jgi:tellurite resistance protein
MEPLTSTAAADAAPASARAVRPWLARVQPGLFGIALGTLGLAGTWLKMQPLIGEVARTIFSALLTAGATVLVIVFVLWMAKVVRHLDVVRQEWTHPVQGPLLALLPVSTLLLVTLLAPFEADGRVAATMVVLAALVLQFAIAWEVVALLSTGRMPADLVTPALYLPIVPGGLVGAMALAAIGYPGWAALLFGSGVGGWALLEARILHQLFAGPLPAPIRPTLGIEIAPAAVSTLAAATLWPQLPADALMVCLGVACGPVIAVLTRWRWWSDVPFSVGFWSFSFPVAALAAATIEAVRRGGWPEWVAWTAVGVASAIIGFLAVRTLLLLLRGRLLPPS